MFRIPTAVVVSSSRLLRTKHQGVCCHGVRCFSAKDSDPGFNLLNDFFPPELYQYIESLEAVHERDTTEDTEDKDKHTTKSELESLNNYGRCWETSDLHSLNTPTLHNLWYVILKERNRMLSLDAYLRQGKRESNVYFKRLKSVQTSIENLQSVIEDREETIATVRTYIWYKRLSKLLGEEGAQEVIDTYTRYTMPFSDFEKKQMKEWKHGLLFSKEYHRWNQPYEETRLPLPESLPATLSAEEEDRLDREKEKLKYEVDNTEYNVPQYDWDTGYLHREEEREALWKEKIRNYESDEYVPEDDWTPGLEGFLHDIKREDWEEMAANPDQWQQSRNRRELDREKIVKRIWDKKAAEDALLSEANIRQWKRRVEGDGAESTDFAFSAVEGNDEDTETN